MPCLAVQASMQMDVDHYLTGVPVALFEPLVILPAQHFDPPQKLAPEYRLMMAVLDDAVWCIEKYRFTTDARGRRLFEAAKQWLLATDLHWPFSFECICAALDLDANAVRRHLRLFPAQTPPACDERSARRKGAWR